MIERPFPPGDYEVVVVGSGPGGLQTSYWLRRLGIGYAVLSADTEPGGMFRSLPVYQRLISWTKPDAPVERGTREYERYDHNSLVAAERELQATVPEFMDRSFDLPSRPEMEQALAAFAERAGLGVRYGCRWIGTRREEDRWVLETPDGDYRCRAAVLAVGMTEPWRPQLPGIEAVPHYVETRSPSDYAGRSVFIVGKRTQPSRSLRRCCPGPGSSCSPRRGRVQSRRCARSRRCASATCSPTTSSSGAGTGRSSSTRPSSGSSGTGRRLPRRDAQHRVAEEIFVFEVDEVIATTGFRHRSAISPSSAWLRWQTAACRR